MKYQVNNIYHIYNQGNNRQKIFFSDSNYEFFLKKMIKHLLPHVDILAYCLMPNHFHWLVRTKESACQDSAAVKPCAKLELEKMAIASKLNIHFDVDTTTENVPSRQQNLSHHIGQLLSSYAKAINKQEKRSGSLFRGKTKSKDGGILGAARLLGDNQEINFTHLNPYWQVCFDYIHSNPTKARLVRDPQEWKYSSIHEYKCRDNARLINIQLAEEIGLIRPGNQVIQPSQIKSNSQISNPINAQNIEKKQPVLINQCKAPKGALHQSPASHTFQLATPFNSAIHRAPNNNISRFNKLQDQKFCALKYDKQKQLKLTQDGNRFLSLGSINKLEEVNTLIDILHFHEWRYYVKDDPILADTQYDALFNLLKSAESKHPDWIRNDSPTQRVGSDLSSDFETVTHLSPMLSLPNSYNEEDLNDFDKQIKKLTLSDEDHSYMVEPKFDGGTVVLLYEDDKLIRAATRGNGEQGDDITHNIRTIRSIPLSANFSEYGITKVELRGEALIRKDRFEAMNEAREKEGQVLFANPRNTATGGLRTKNPKESEARSIEAFIYQISWAEGPGKDKITHHDDSIKLLENLGFKVPRAESKLCDGIQEAAKFCALWQEKRDSYAYEIDGMVVKLNDFELQQRVGETSHHPRWAMAYKFKAKQATTVLEQIVYQVGKIGTITPVAKVRPVGLAGVTVSSISLHNEDFIHQKDLRLGDNILIERAGDVIPYIVKSFPDLRTGQEKVIEFPKYCPINSNEQLPVALIRDENEAAWRCPNCVCGTQDMNRMAFFVSKDAMNLDGMGKSIIEKFHELNWLKDVSDIYQLDYDAIATQDGFGERSAEKIKLAVEKSKSNPIYRLLYSLGIHHLGKRASKIFAAEVKNILDLRNWSEEQFKDLKDIGPVVAKNTFDWFSRQENIDLLNRLEKHGVNLNQTDEDLPKDFSEGPLAGKTILFTGTLLQMARKEAQKIAEELGAKNISAVSKNLNILVAGEKAGSKLKKAQSIGTVEILSEEDFLALR